MSECVCQHVTSCVVFIFVSSQAAKSMSCSQYKLEVALGIKKYYSVHGLEVSAYRRDSNPKGFNSVKRYLAEYVKLISVGPALKRSNRGSLEHLCH